jgi:hypothetical protein
MTMECRTAGEREERARIERVAAPGLAFVVATDTFETIRGVVTHLRRQTVASRLELVIVCPDRTRLALPDGVASGLASLVIIEHPLVPLIEARARAISAATAELVFVGETHVFPEPEWAERVITAHDRATWAAVVPRIENANPRTRLSRAALVLDYGPWMACAAGQLQKMPGANVVLRRSMLLSAEHPLADLLDPEVLNPFMRGQGGIYHATDARLLHLNVSRGVAWTHERYLCGRLVGGVRAQRWGHARRGAYAMAVPLIAAVLAGRALRSLPLSWRDAGVALLIVCGSIIQAAGEGVGYIGGSLRRAEEAMQAYEVSKARHAMVQ